MGANNVSKIYSLNKVTYINLRWIGIFGQFIAINIAKYLFDFDFYIILANFVIFLGIISNFFLIYFYKKKITCKSCKNIHNIEIVEGACGSLQELRGCAGFMGSSWRPGFLD